MKISKFKIAWKYLTGGIGGVIDYLLDILNAALARIKPDDRQTIQAVLNLTYQTLATIEKWRWLCPAKWQSALTATIGAVNSIVCVLADLEITREELAAIRADFAAAVEAWKSGDDSTCVTPEDLFE